MGPVVDFGQDARPGSGPKAGDGEAQRLRWLVTDASLPLVEPVARAFEASHPGWRVEVERVRLSAGLSQARAFLRGKLDAGEVDLVSPWPLISTAELALEGRVQPLDPLLAAGGAGQLDLAAYGIVDGLRVKGQLYDLPLAVYPLVMLYNADRLAEVGLPAPEPEPLAPAELMGQAKSLAVVAGPNHWALSVGAPGIWLETTLGAEGLSRPDPGPAIPLLQVLGELARVEHGILEAGPMPPAAGAALGDGLAALRVDLLPVVPAGGYPFRWGIAPPPGWQDSALPVPATWLPTVAIATHSPRPDAAWTLLRYAAGEEGALILARAGHLPGFRTARVQEAWVDAVGRVAGARWLAGVPLRVVGRLPSELERRREEALGLTAGEVLALRIGPAEGAERLRAAWQPP